jgi:UvrD-like helicase C-terminal domain/AAA domain
LSLEYFEGPAGCGKTYQLIKTLETFLAGHPLSEGEAVLGLTYMHGSRRRMQNQLGKMPSLRGRFLACTVDSLARRLICRWRTLAKDLEPKLNLMVAVDFTIICRAAALAIAKENVSSWLKLRYPVVVVDEFQDCKGDQLYLIQAMESCCHVIAAADEFQDLQQSGPSVAVQWLHAGAGKKNILSGNRRTNETSLLQAANRLRVSQDCGDILQNALMSALNANVAAAHIARTICWKQPKDAVILTPTGQDKSQFVRDVVTRLTSKPIKPKGINKDVGPFRVIWESNIEEDKASLLKQIGCSEHGIGLAELRQLSLNDRGALGDVYQWAEKKWRIKGQSHFLEAELKTIVERVLQSRRAFLPTTCLGSMRAMTINQAKNREFEGVIVLWPFAVGGDLDSQRRRLYNALTRAKKWAVVIVQDAPQKASRLSVPPFSKPLKSGPEIRHR